MVCTPLCASTGELEAVLELVRRTGAAFTEEDVEIINSYLVWAGLALHFADKVCRNTEEKLLTDFLASVVSSISCDVVLVDSLLLQVINQCQKMILACFAEGSTRGIGPNLNNPTGKYLSVKEYPHSNINPCYGI